MYLGVELVVAQVERRVDGLERLEVEVHPLLLSLVGHDSPAVDHQPVRGHSGVEPAVRGYPMFIGGVWSRQANLTHHQNVHKPSTTPSSESR